MYSSLLAGEVDLDWSVLLKDTTAITVADGIRTLHGDIWINKLLPSPLNLTINHAREKFRR